MEKQTVVRFVHDETHPHPIHKQNHQLDKFYIRLMLHTIPFPAVDNLEGQDAILD
jgi:hypothetical protein